MYRGRMGYSVFQRSVIILLYFYLLGALFFLPIGVWAVDFSIGVEEGPQLSNRQTLLQEQQLTEVSSENSAEWEQSLSAESEPMSEDTDFSSSAAHESSDLSVDPSPTDSFLLEDQSIPQTVFLEASQEETAEQQYFLYFAVGMLVTALLLGLILTFLIRLFRKSP